MAYPANLRGWGPGWPTNRIADQVWVTAARSGVRFLVHREIAPLLKFLVDEVERRGYLLHVEGDTPDDWSFNSRPIRGTNTPSNHSWGLAIDIDATKYPQGQRRRRPPQWIVDLFGAYGFEWGGGWRTPDPMHFEFAGSRTEARWLTAALAASHVAKQPVPVPPTAPKPEPPPAEDEEDDMGAYVRASDTGAVFHFTAEHWRHMSPRVWANRQALAAVAGKPIEVQPMHSLQVLKFIHDHDLLELPKAAS